MIEIAGFRDIEKIHESHRSMAFHAIRESDDRPVFLKTTKDPYPHPKELLRYEREYALLRGLGELSGVGRAFGLERVAGTLVMILEDSGGQSLRKWMKARKFSLAEALSLSAQLARHLGALHTRQIIHKDINPGNVIYNPANGQLKIIDFDIATTMPREAFDQPAQFQAGTTAYISPEQTGRINRMVDYRTDYYSFGVTLFQLISGRLPFDAITNDEMIKCHTRLPPPRLHQIDPDVPVAVADLVSKLMAKDPDERYQSAHGIQADLEECLRQLREQGHIEPFNLGGQDTSYRLVIPQRLFGREPLLTSLLELLRQVAQGEGQLLFVTGPAGIGKTALIRELYGPIIALNGHFVSGKFDQLQNQIPYTAFAAAFRQLVLALLGESDELLSRWRHDILEAVQPNGRILVDLIPELELILGPQPAVPILPSAEQMNRFNLIFERFVSVCARQEHPLVLFLDDLQWVDPASLRLLTVLMTSPMIQHIYCIGAFRETEVNEAHPLQAALGEIAQSTRQVTTLALNPLTRDEVAELLSQTVHQAPESLAPLADLVLGKTGGNPFSISQFLDMLHLDGLLQIDPVSGGWNWELERIRAAKITDDVAKRMTTSLERLPPAVQEILTRASCLGNQFDLESLSLLTGGSLKQTAQGLSAAAQSGHVIPLSDGYKLFECDERAALDASGVLYRFAHDRIQQAAYLIVPQESRAALHRSIGLALQEKLPDERRANRLFDIAYHLNLGSKAITNAQERLSLAALNLQAGRQAKASSAFQQALTLLSTGRELLGERAWEEHYDLTLALCQEAAEAAFLTTQFELLERFVAEVIREARTLSEQVKVYQLRIQRAVSQRELNESVRTALEVLRQLGHIFPQRPTKLQVLQGYLRTKLAMTGKRLARLEELGEMTDPQELSAITIMRTMGTALYVVNPNLMALFAFRQFCMVLRDGHSHYSPSILASFGIILCGAVGDFELAYRIGIVALRLRERFPETRRQCRVLWVMNGLIRHWKEHLKETMEPLKASFELGVAHGDFEFAASSCHVYCQHELYLGLNLASVEADLAHYSQQLLQIRQDIQRLWNSLFHQAVLNLLGRSQDPTRLIGPSYDLNKHIPLQLAQNDRTGICAAHFLSCMLNCLFGDFDRAAYHGEQGMEYLNATAGLFGGARFVFYDTLAAIQIAPKLERARKKKTWKHIHQNLRKMKKFAASAPANHLHALCLLQAELYRVQGKRQKAMDSFERATSLARAQGFPNDEALALEQSAVFYLSQGKRAIAESLLLSAYRAYRRWGAQAKLPHLAQRYPWIAFDPSPQPNS